jgi:hypothetical protein
MTDSALPAGIEAPTVAEFHVLAATASRLGRPVIPALMLLARDGHQPLGRLCAICAIGRMSSTVPAAKEALSRIARLPKVGRHDYVIRAAIADYRWPFTGSWDPLQRMESLDVDWWDASLISARAPRLTTSSDVSRSPTVPAPTEKPVRRDRVRTRRRGHSRPDPDLFPDGWWREQE